MASRRGASASAGAGEEDGEDGRSGAGGAETGTLNSNSESSGRGKYGCWSPPLRMMQWKRSCATATGQYVSSFRPPLNLSKPFVSRSGIQRAWPGVRQ